MKARARPRYSAALTETTTTAAIAEAAGVTGKTVRDWAKRGLLPTPRKSHRGRRGTVALWPDGTIAQAVWVKAQLEGGRTIPEILAALAAGEYSAKEDG